MNSDLENRLASVLEHEKEAAFKEYVDGLQEEQRPRGFGQKAQMFVEWWDGLEMEPARKRIFDSAQYKVLRLLEEKAKDAELLPGGDAELLQGWLLISSSVKDEDVTYKKPEKLRTPDGEEHETTAWVQVGVKVAKWLFNKDKRILDKHIGTALSRERTNFHREKIGNGLWLNVNLNAGATIRQAARLIEGTRLEFKVKLRE